MSDLERRLTDTMRVDAPPARDASFRVDVLVRLERARFRRQVALSVAVALVVAVFAAATAPALDAWMEADIQRAWIVALGAVVAMFGLSAALVGTRPGLRNLVSFVDRWLYP